MSADVADLCRRLKALGWDVERISRCVRLPEFDVRNIVR